MNLLKILFTWLLMVGASLNTFAQKEKDLNPYPPIVGSDESEELAA